ncbi:MAG: cobalamin B12-binding domain-containing protein [Bacillota bacterium]
MADVTRAFKNVLLSSDIEAATAILEGYLVSKTALEFVDEVVVKVLDEIGDGWYEGKYALSQVYMSGRICEDLLEKALPDESGLRKDKPKIALALLNDYHVLGKRIVYAVLRSGGFQIVDYGRVEVDELVRRVKEDKIEILLISVLMLSSAFHVREIVSSLSNAGEKVKIVVGGAPFRLDRKLWQEVGADAVGYTATDALHIVRSLEGVNRNE